MCLLAADYHQNNKATLSSLFRAIKHSDSIKAARWRVNKEQSTKAALESEYLPKVGASIGIGTINQPFLFEPYRKFGASIEAEWNLFDGLRSRIANKAQDAIIQSRIDDEESTLQKLYYQASQDYYGYFKALSLLKALNAQQQELQANIERLEKFYVNGLVAADALEAIRSQIAQNAYQRNSTELLAKTHAHNLEWLSQEPFADIEIETLTDSIDMCLMPDTTPMQTLKTSTFATPRLPTDLSSHDVSYSVITPQPPAELRAFNKHVDALQAQINAYNYLPKIDLFAKIEYFNFDKLYIPDLPLTIPITDSDLRGTQATVGLKIAFPIFSGFALIHQREAARYDYLSAKSQYAHQKREIEYKLNIATQALKNAQQKITWTQTQAKSARIAYCYAQKKFQSGLISHTEYLSSLALELQARSSFEESFLDYELAKIQMIFIAGGKLEDFIQ